ncbi:uncharacterized protein VNE69_07103 [Vairimorpha necatrix]|uniref:Uncharacterized protein n=1 Tax=Vairimorpha necatrix TaxID=6039 RepID=A0AAX4JDJ8_9MICR
MNKKVLKTIELIKRSYAQPLIFNTLINHLSFLLESCNPLYEMTDDWSKILIYSVTPNRIPNQGLDSKILNLLKKLRKDKLENESKLKIQIILYYMKNRKLKYSNHLIVYELVTNYMEINDFFDGLIISIFCSSINANLFGLEQNQKYRHDSVIHLLKMILKYKLSDINRFISLPLFIQYDLQFNILDFDLQNDLQTFCKLESICFFAKFCKNENFIKKVMPKNEIFLDFLGKFINREFVIYNEKFKVNLLLEDREIFEKIEEEYKKSNDPIKFKNDLLDFISNL